jgi:hypothetical protein
MLRLDLIMTNWIFVWFVLYMFGIITYNPSIYIVIGGYFAIFGIYIIWCHGSSQYKLQHFTLINILMKCIPIIILWSQNDLRVEVKDIYFGIFLFIMYLIYLHLNGTNFFEVYISLMKINFKYTLDENEDNILIV